MRRNIGWRMALGALLGGRSLGNVEGLTEENRAFLDEGLDVDAAAQAISANQFDPSALVWTQDGESTTMEYSYNVDSVENG